MIYIIADDLTGASDTGAQYRRCGLRTLISAGIDLSMLDNLPCEFDVISINADTRTLLPQEAYNTVYELVKRIKMKEHKYIYKKIDSVARGNAPQELEAVMDALDVSLAVVTTSYPANGRTLLNGKLLVSDKKGIESEVDVIKIFHDSMSRRVHGINLETVHQGKDALQSAIEKGYSKGIQVFVIDAVTDEDLALVRDASLALEEKIVFCGSAGLAQQLSALEISHKGNKPLPEVGTSIIIVIVGSYHQRTEEQVQALVDEMGMPIITIFATDILDDKYEQVETEFLHQVDKLISSGCVQLSVVLDSLFSSRGVTHTGSVDDTSDSLKLAGALGRLVKQLRERYFIGAIVSSGGDTSLAVLKSLGAKGIELDCEIESGIPAGRLIGGIAEGMTIVTKSGGFGKKDSLINSVRYLRKKTMKEGI